MKTESQREKPAERSARQSRRVLIVTNDAHDPLRASLESAGLEVVGMSAGAAALVSLQRSRPHLVIANIATKGISSHEFTRMLSQGDEGTPLLLVGAEAATLDRRQAALAAVPCSAYSRT
jgi:CheY-like chemotaxis protein